MRSIGLIGLGIALLAVAPITWEWAEDSAGEGRSETRINIMGGQLDGTYLWLVNDLALMTRDKGFRVIPMVGFGSVQAYEDLRESDIDFATMQSDVLHLGGWQQPDDQLRYVMPLYDEEMHVLAKKSIGTFRDLHGKRVNLGPKTAGTFISATIVLDELGVVPQISTMTQSEAIESLRAGELDALIRVVGQPNGVLAQLTDDDDLHFLPVPAVKMYDSAMLRPESYPQLMEQPVQTISVASVLATRIDPDDQEQRDRIERFTSTVLRNFGELKDERYHPKWLDVDPTVEIAGWARAVDPHSYELLP